MKWIIGIAVVVLIIIATVIAPWINRATRAEETVKREITDLKVEIAKQKGLEVATFAMG